MRSLLAECLQYISFSVARTCIKMSLFYFLSCRADWWLILYTPDVTPADCNAPRKPQMLSMMLKCAITDDALLLRTLLSYVLCHNTWKTSFQWVHSPCNDDGWNLGNETKPCFTARNHSSTPFRFHSLSSNSCFLLPLAATQNTFTSSPWGSPSSFPYSWALRALFCLSSRFVLAVSPVITTLCCMLSEFFRKS